MPPQGHWWVLERERGREGLLQGLSLTLFRLFCINPFYKNLHHGTQLEKTEEQRKRNRGIFISLLFYHFYLFFLSLSLSLSLSLHFYPCSPQEKNSNFTSNFMKVLCLLSSLDYSHNFICFHFIWKKVNLILSMCSLSFGFREI